MFESLWRHEGGEFFTEAQIRQRHPLSIFQWPFQPLQEYVPVIDEPTPEFDVLTHEARIGEPTLDAAGVWSRTVSVVALPPEVAAANLEADRRARVPLAVTRAQGKVALHAAGLWPQVLSFVDAIPDAAQQFAAQAAIHDALEWRRDSPFLKAAAAALDLTEVQLDQLFIAASQVTL